MERKKENPSGFTLVELSFAVLFIAVLLLTVAMITSQIIGAYRKGVSMKTINQVGREVIEDLRMSITNSPATLTDEVKGNPNVTYNTFTAPNTIKSKEAGNSVSINDANLAGVFCTGQYSYVWNTGYRFSSDYTDASGGSITGGIRVRGVDGYLDNSYPHLLRVTDTERLACTKAAEFGSGSVTLNGSETLDLEGKATNPVELISSETITDSRTDAPVALYDFYVSAPPAFTANNGRLFYSGSFILGTTSGGVNVTSAGNNCKVPNDQTYANSNFNYCAVNKFNFAVQSSSI